LEKKVQELTGTNEEMSTIVSSLYDFAVKKGLLQREPEFGQQLQSATERFLALAKASANDSRTDNQEDGAKIREADHGRCPNGQKAHPKRHQEDVQPVSEEAVSKPPISQTNPAYGVYILSEDDTTDIQSPYTQEDHFGDNQFGDNQFGDNQFGENLYRTHNLDIEIIMRPTKDNACFSFDSMDLQQYRVEVPQPGAFSHKFSPTDSADTSRLPR
jgi:hypothetical protein